jgi:hypothetical protein
VTEYGADITDNPLSRIAQMFVDKIISEYYHWNYYRVNNNRIEDYSFTNNENGIFYIEWAPSASGETTSRIIKKLSFDAEFEEIIIEDFLDTTKAGFDQCELLIDPMNNNIICNEWDKDIKIYSETNGLINVPDSEQLQPVTFPNGELFFYNNQEQFVEELGYYTTLLYTIDEDGQLTSHYIELGERNSLCQGDCTMGIQIDMFTPEGEAYGDDYLYAEVVISNGEAVYYEADLEFVSVSEFDSQRPACEDVNGCWYETTYQILDEESNVAMSFQSYGTYYPEDEIPSYVYNYALDENSTIEYAISYFEEDKVCENEIGCSVNIMLIDYSTSDEGTWVSQNIIVNQGEKIIQTIMLASDNSAEYEYEKDYVGELCEEANCPRYVAVSINNIEGEEVYYGSFDMMFSLGETVPVRIEYNITDNTSIVYSTETCSYQYGCYESYATPENQYFSIHFEYGELLYQSITFAETDKQVVYNETVQREVCMEINGCWYGDSVYEIVDELGSVLYSFTDGIWIQYGATAPFKVTATLDQATLQYQQIGTQMDSVCNQASCTIDYPVYLLYSNRESIHLGYNQERIEQGEKIIQSMNISADSFVSSQNQNVCTMSEGCSVSTTNYIILDADGNEIQNTYNEWRSGLPVLFAYGEAMPQYNEFIATFNIQNMEYQKQRVSVYEFIYRIDQAIALDENLYLIESDSWTQGDENFILTFNEETSRYSVKFTNMSAVLEITEVDDGFIAINDSETAIIKFTFNEELSTENYYFFDVVNLTEGLQINGVNDLIVDYDGSIYFKGVDNFIQEITGSINEFGEIQVDTEYTEHDVVRVRPIN